MSNPPLSLESVIFSAGYPSKWEVISVKQKLLQPMEKKGDWFEVSHLSRKNNIRFNNLFDAQLT